VLGRARIDRLSGRAREASGEMNAHAVDSVQGLGEIVAFQQEARRGEALAARAAAYAQARMPSWRTSRARPRCRTWPPGWAASR